MKIQFTTSHRLLQELLIAKRSLSLSRVLKKWANCDGLIIADIGYVQQDREEMELPKWDRIFKDPVMAGAAIDRLIHHCVILEMNMSALPVEAFLE
jgi:DNA replication protein DnaC